MKSNHKLHILSVAALGVFCLLAAGSMEDKHGSPSNVSVQTKPSYIEEGKGINGIGSTFGRLRLDATANDIDCVPDKSYTCSFQGNYSDGEKYSVDFYLDASQTPVYRASLYHYTFTLPYSVSQADAVKTLEKKLGPGTWQKGQFAGVFSEDYVRWDDGGGSYAIAYLSPPNNPGSPSITLEVSDRTKEMLHNQQIAARHMDKDAKEKQDFDQKLLNGK